MNGLTLRISGTNSKKIKGSIAFRPVNIPQQLVNKLGDGHTLYETFNKCDSVDKQLAVLRDNLTAYNETMFRFFVLIFLQAEIKHPVKCFLVRYITKNNGLQEPFSKALADEISSHMSTFIIDIKVYMDFVPKVASCLENFPAGALAVKQVDLTLAQYLTQCLQTCVETLRCMNLLSPTEKNEIFNLAHLSLRLLLYIVQKVDPESSSIVISHFSEIKYNIKELLLDVDVPMDTKSVCGLLLVAMYMLENGSKSWIEILHAEEHCEFSDFLRNNAGKLSLYSAIVTAVPSLELSAEVVGDEPALLILTNNILVIGEETVSDSTFTLGVTRTLLQISKSLPKTSEKSLGLKLVEALLTFVWRHLEHHMDSVRHLAAQVLTNVVRYCTELKKKGDDEALDSLFSTLSSLDRGRRGYYTSVTALAAELGAGGVLSTVPALICGLIGALDVQAVRASATTALETLLQKHSREATSEAVNRSWVVPIITHVTTKDLDSAVLNILESLLLQAVKLNERVMDYILPYIKQIPGACGRGRDDLKCVLMLLSVIRKCNGAAGLPQADGEWKGLVSYELLKTGAVDAVDETRTLTLSLIVESPKSTEPFTAEELELVLWYLQYNVNVESPNFRQLTLSLMKKFMKRLEDSYKVLMRQNLPEAECNKCHYYLTFMESLRALCYECLVRDVNYSRRHAALQLLVWSERARLDGYQRSWSVEYVENLLMHLEDSYESNKALALEVLSVCPVELIQSQKRAAGLETDAVVRLTRSARPADCATAAYRLRLLVARLPRDLLPPAGRGGEVPEAVRYAALRLMLRTLRSQLDECARSVAWAARHAPMYGALHCMLHQLERVDAGAICKDGSWSRLVEEIVGACVEVNAAVACVVNNSSPEGHLPMDMTDVVLTDHGNSGNVRLEDGRPVTAQMVLLCAWRSVKEVSLVLGSISSRMSIEGEEQEAGTLRQQQLVLIGEHFTKLLAETKHRGAFEQAYVGFTKLLTRLWRCRSPTLHELPRTWLRELMLSIAKDDGSGVFSSTRRSAGLPFMIQALVTTELEVSERPKCFEECVRALMHVCASSGGHARAHARNVLRALVRCAALRQHVAQHIGSALRLALDGFDGTTWEERNSSTLLLSALVVRVWGVPRAGSGPRASERLPARTRMTGRLFFLRYPRLYDYMLEKLNEVSTCDETQLLKPSLYPMLLLLARLCPSALEGTVSNLKLSCFVEPVLACARSAVLKTRELAARALVPLVAPAMYLPHIERMLTLLCDTGIKRNFCHGVLLQVTKLLENRPDSLTVGAAAGARLRALLRRTTWMLELTEAPRFCYPLADEYVKMLNMIVWRFPTLIDEATVDLVMGQLDGLLAAPAHAHPGAAACLARAASLHLVLATKYGSAHRARDLVHATLSHAAYEVTLSALNYLLILKQETDAEDTIQEHLAALTQDKSTSNIITSDPRYTLTLYKVLKTVKYLECKRKCLKLLCLEDNTYRYVIEDEGDCSDEVMVCKLSHLVDTVHANMTHIYLYSLLRFVGEKLVAGRAGGGLLLDAVRVIFACTAPDNSYNTREVSVDFLEENFKQLIELELNDLNEEDKFEAQATLWASLVSVLEDDEEALRRRGARVLAALGDAASGGAPTVGARAAETLRSLAAARCPDGALLCTLALLDAGARPPLDEADDEWRVFEQSERSSAYAEGGAWAAACARALRRSYGREARARALSVLRAPRCARALAALCGENARACAALLDGRERAAPAKLRVFVRELSR